MLEKIFNRITQASIKYKWVTIGISVLVLIIGAFATTQLKQELIPSIEFPQTIILGFNSGAEADAVLNEVTIPIEQALSEVDGVVNVESTTSNGVVFLIARNEFGLNQEEIRADIQTRLNELDYPDGMEIPELLTFSFADLPMASVSVSADDLSLDELKELVESDINPQLEELEGVAAVEVGGGQELPTEPPPTADPTLEPTPEPTEVPTATPTEAPTPTEAAPTETPEGTVSEPEPVALPDSWVQAGAAQNITLETTADLTPELVGGIASFAPVLLDDLTPEMLLAMPLDALAALPVDYLAGLDAALLNQLASREEPGGDVELGDDDVEIDPRELPAAWQAAGSAQNIELRYPEEITVEIMRGISEFAPQLLDMLTPLHLRALTPEVIGWLPAAFVEGLDADLRTELDTLAQAVGGPGALAVAAEEEAEALSEGAPALSGVWLEPPPDDGTGAPAFTFATAADLLTTGFTESGAELLNLLVDNTGDQAPQLIGDLTPDVIAWLIENEEGFLESLNPATLRLFSSEVLNSLPEDFLSSLDDDLRTELEGLAAGTIEVFIPTDTINRVNGNPSLGLSIFQDQEANTVSTSHLVFDKFDELEADNPGLHFDIVFEQASFIEESIRGVSTEGGLGAIFAVLIILIFLSGRVNGKYKLSWRSTLVTAVSIPLSVLMAFMLFRWLPPLISPLFDPLVEGTRDVAILGPMFRAMQSLFPVGLTLNIMTLSGMTVAVGRVVDDSIVVLENIYRHIQRGEDLLTSVTVGTRDVSIAIFASTATTVVVFLPIGLLGGLIGGFFLPFGIAVSYALASSFLVAITIVPLLAFMFIRKEHLPSETETPIQKRYTPILEWALKNRGWTLGIAGLLLVGSLFLFGTRPQAFLPSFGEVQVAVAVDMPGDIKMSETNDLTLDFENALQAVGGISTVQTQIGSGSGLAAAFFGSSIDQGVASINIGVEDLEMADAVVADVREVAQGIFGMDNVTVSAGSLSEGGFGGFALIASGDPDTLAEFNDEAIAALENVDGLANVSSNLADASAILRVDGEPAIRFGGELETADTLGVTQSAKEVLLEIAPASLTIAEGFETQQQTEGFTQAVSAIGVSVVIVYLVMVVTFGSFIHPFTILFSLPMAIIGASVALWISNSILGLSSLIGLMMLVGIVVTNAIVLIDRVQANRQKRGMNLHDALMEGGRTRLRPILMTALAAILALVPLAIGLSEGAIIASELAIVVIGGLTTSTLLTLLVVPVMYSLLDRFAKDKVKK